VDRAGPMRCSLGLGHAYNLFIGFRRLAVSRVMGQTHDCHVSLEDGPVAAGL